MSPPTKKCRYILDTPGKTMNNTENLLISADERDRSPDLKPSRFFLSLQILDSFSNHQKRIPILTQLCAVVFIKSYSLLTIAFDNAHLSHCQSTCRTIWYLLIGQIGPHTFPGTTGRGWNYCSREPHSLVQDTTNS